MLENPELLRKMVKETGAYSTDLQSPERVDLLCDKCISYAQFWEPEADRLRNGKADSKIFLEYRRYMYIMKRAACVLFTVIGLLCILFPGRITAGLPYVLGGVMTAAGILYGAAYFRDRAAWTARSSELASGLVLLVVGALCMFHGADSIGPLGTTWAIIGLRKASKSLSRMIQNRGRGIAFYTAFAEFLLRLTFSVMLLFYPAEKFEAHVILLGLEMITASIRLTKRISPALDVDE